MRPSGVFNATYNQDMAIVRTKTQWGMFIGAMVALAVFPLVVSDTYVSWGIWIAYYIIAVLGLNILFGYAGQISIGHIAFVGVGAYVSANLVNHLGFNFFLALPLAGLGAALVGTVFGLPSLRLKGFYLAMATFAAYFIIIYFFNNIDDMTSAWRAWFPQLTGGMMGTFIDRPSIPFTNFVFDTDVKYFYLMAAVTAIMVFFAKNIVRTRVGRAFVAIRDNDIAAEVMGISVYRYKLLAFAIGNFYAGIAGALIGHYIGFLTPEHYQFFEGIWMLGMVVVGGMGYTMGPIFGATVLQLLKFWAVPAVASLAGAYLTFLPDQTLGRVGAASAWMFFALVVILMLIFEPRGIAHRWELFKASYRLHPFSY
ncbi:MAG: branched-chain amino acid ABC transporter permease [Dehalococcoidia bacterium]